MTKKRQFSVAQFGLDARERRVLSSTCRLSVSRARQFVMTDEITEAEIIVFDTESAAATRQLQILHSESRNAAVVRLGSEASSEHELDLIRPLSATGLFKALDAATIAHFNFVPELVVKDNEQGGRISDISREVVERAKWHQPTEKKQALVVDDSAAVRQLMQIHLGLLGIDLEYAETGERALELTAERHFDLVFLDVMLPGKDGYTVCKEIRLRDKETPVIMLTSKSSNMDKMKGHLAGATAYLTKPVAQDKLQAAIAKYLPSIAQHEVAVTK